MSPAAAYARDSTRLSLLVEPGRNRPPGPCPGDDLRGHRGAALGQGAVRRGQIGHRPDQLVRAHAEGGVRLLEPTARLAQLIAFQVHPGECDECRGVGVRPAGRCSCGHQVAWPANSAARPSRPRKASTSARSPRQSARSSSPAEAASAATPDSRVTGRLGQLTRPQLDGSAAGQHAGPDLRMPGELAARDGADQQLRTGSGRRRRHQVPGAQGSGEADNRGGQPGRDLLIGGKTLQEPVGGIQRGRLDSDRPADNATAARDQVRLQVRPRLGRAACPRTRSAREGPPRGSMISPIASPSMTMLAASCQSLASAACRTAKASWPFRSYHRAARRCKQAIRSGCSRLSSSRSTSTNNGW